MFVIGTLFVLFEKSILEVPNSPKASTEAAKSSGLSRAILGTQVFCIQRHSGTAI